MSNPTKISSIDSTDRNNWVWGFTPQSEIWNGRFAMIGFISVVLVEVFSGQGFLHYWGIL